MNDSSMSGLKIKYMIYLSSAHVGSLVLMLLVGLQFKTMFFHSEPWNKAFSALLITLSGVVINGSPAFSS